MSSSRRLSLRARMLVVLIGVTTMFLLINGVVSTVILARNVTSQFEGNLMTAADYRPADITSNLQNYPAVQVTADSGRAGSTVIRPLTGPPSTAQLAGAVRAMIARHDLTSTVPHGKTISRAPFNLTSPRGLRLLAVVRVVSPSDPYKVLVVAQPASVAMAKVWRFIIAELITGGALIGLLALGGEWLIARGLDPLGEMASTASDITSRGDLTARMPDADLQTEVGMLGSAINTMLDRIQQAFGARLRSEQKVREFAADASHELRTPLTTIRGYAELYRQGALVVDEPRIRQVLANLLGNAAAHTPVTTPVAVRLGAITGGVLIEVADAGPGMAAQDATRAFDRFHRAAGRDGADPGPSADRAAAPDSERTSGSGLGLSIVQAIARAHGGRATLESWPGHGTKVRVWLPQATRPGPHQAGWPAPRPVPDRPLPT